MKKGVPNFICFAKITGLILALIIVSLTAKAQTASFTTPATNPNSYPVGTGSSPFTLTAQQATLDLATNVVFSFPALGINTTVNPPFAGYDYTTNINLSTLAIGSYTLTATFNSRSVLGVARTPVVRTQTILIAPPAPSATPTSTCSGTSATISVSGGSPAGGTYYLYSAATNGTLLAVSTGTTLTAPPITANTTFYVAYVYNGIESARTSVAVSVSTAPAAPTFTISSTSVNLNATTAVTLTSPVAGITYSFNFGGGTINSGTGNGPYVVAWSTPGLKAVTVTATNTGGCSTTTTQTVLVNTTLDPNTYAFNHTITLKTSLAGLQTSTSLANFPVLVYIKEDALKTVGVNCSNNVYYPTGGPTGYDFAFTLNNSTTELFYQVDTYDPVTGTLLAWVKLPTVTPTDAVLNFYFGSLTPNHTDSFTEATWNTDYQAVYHFSEASTTATILDATYNNRDAAQTDLSISDDKYRSAIGISGGAYSFNGTSSKVVSPYNANITGSFTLSAWVRTPTPTSDSKIISNEVNYGRGYKLSVKNGNVETETRNSTNSSPGNLLNTAAVTANTWQYIQGVYDSGAGTFTNYVNGVASTTKLTSTTLAPQPGIINQINLAVDLLSPISATNYFGGSMDEVRISNAPKSSEWIKAEYYNQNNLAAFTVCSTTINSNPSVAAAIGGSLVYTWTGGAGSTSITATNNWTSPAAGNPNGAPPTNGVASIIVPNVTNKPVLAANANFYGVTVAAGSNFNLAGFTLTVGCNVYNSGTINPAGVTNTSTLVWNGIFTPQLYVGNNNTGTAQFGNITINNTTASGQVRFTNGPTDLYNILTLTAGNLIIDNASNGALTLKSSLSAPLTYAQIATIPTGLSIQGQINDEVLIQGGPGYRNYRSMAAPIYNNTSTYTTANGSFLLNGLKNTFIITGAGGVANGFDASSNNGATLRVYNSAAGNYTFVTSLLTNTFVNSGSGYYMYFRGDRINTPGTPNAADPFGSKTNKTLGGGSYAVPETVMLTYTGVANQGNVTPLTIPASTSGTLYHIANPYAATLDAGSLITTSGAITNNTWTWNPNIGAYAIYDNAIPMASTNGAKRYVVPGQGFFVKALNTATSAKALTITESMKSVTNAANAVRLLSTSAPAETVELPVMRLQLSKNKDIFDEIAVVLKPDTKDSAEAADAQQMSGDNIVFTTITPDNKYLSIDKRPFTNQSKKIIPLYISTASDTIYTFKHTYLSNLMSNYKVTLFDSLLNNNVEIANIDYSVNIYKGQPETWGGKRFKLIIEQKAAPVTFFDFSGKLTADRSALLSWKTSEHRFGTAYQLQRSTDNKSFTDVGLKQAGTGDAGSSTFSQEDKDIQAGTTYYRLVQTDVFNNQLISEVVKLDYNPALVPSASAKAFKLYPNPVVTDFYITSDKTYTGKITMRVYDSNSNLKYTNTFTQLSPYTPVQRNVSDLRLGVYIVELRDKNDKVLTTLKFVKQ